MHSAEHCRGIVTPNNGMRPKVRGQGELKTSPPQSTWAAFAPKFSKPKTRFQRVAEPNRGVQDLMVRDDVEPCCPR